MGIKKGSNDVTIYKWFVEKKDKDSKQYEKPYFYEVKKEDGAWKNIPAGDELEGEIQSVAVNYYVYEEKEIPTISVRFKDDEGLYFSVQFPLTIATRSLLNAIASLPNESKKLFIKTYLNKEGFVSFYVCNGKPTNEDEKKSLRLSWKYSHEEIPEIVKIFGSGRKKNEVIAIDDTECNDFFIDTVISKDLKEKGIKVFVDVPGADNSSDYTNEGIQPSESNSNASQQDDLPF